MSHFKKQFGIIKTIIILAAIIIIGFFSTEKVFACSCVVPGTPEEEMKKFDAVFMGTVTSISERNVSDFDPTQTRSIVDPVKIGINVGHSWKGVTTDFIYVYTGYGSGDCGYPVTGYETYLFYASGPIDNLSISICSRTSLYREAQEDRSYLGQLQELSLRHVLPQNADSIEDNKMGIIFLLGGLTIVLFIAVIYLIVINQKMRRKNNK